MYTSMENWKGGKEKELGKLTLQNANICTWQLIYSLKEKWMEIEKKFNTTKHYFILSNL